MTQSPAQEDSMASKTPLDAKLLPCPFCNGDKARIGIVRDGLRVHCPSCGSAGAAEFHGPTEMASSRERATAAWNRRSLSSRSGEAADEAYIDQIAECMWQAEWARAGNGGVRRVPWSELNPNDHERYRFVARRVASIARKTTGEAEAPSVAALQAEIERLRQALGWIDSWVSNPVGAYSVMALDGLFAATRDRIAAISPSKTAQIVE